MNHLESKHPNKLNFYSIGKSPGWLNYLTDREDPKNIYVAEVSNNIDDQTSFREKEKVLFSLSLHGFERQGVEAGSRFIENLLEGREQEIEALLDDLVLLFVYANPDGWVSRHPQYNVPGVPNYSRTNAKLVDTNRQLPITGWIHPVHYPAEPYGLDLEDDDPGVDMDVPNAVRELVPDVLAIVEHFRNYENLNYGADLHGLLESSEFVLGLISQNQFDHRQLHELYQMNRDLDATLEEAFTPWKTVGNVQKTVIDDADPTGKLPSEVFTFSGIWDALGFTSSGFMGDWFAHPESMGGLGMTAMSVEMALTSGTAAYNPELARRHILSYKTVMRTIAKFAVQYTNTPNTEDEFKTIVETGNLKTAFVTTDALTRSSANLDPPESDSDNTSEASSERGNSVSYPHHLQKTNKQTINTGETLQFYESVQTDTRTLSLVIKTLSDSLVSAELYTPDGELVRAFDPANHERIRDGTISWIVRNPDVGEWKIVVNPVTGADIAGSTAGHEVDPPEIIITTSHDPLTPPPKTPNYNQRQYKVSPFVFFDKEFIPENDPLRTNEVERDYADVTDSPVDSVTIRGVKEGVHHEYENLIVIHDEGNKDDLYLDELEKFISDGGNLVLTDTGVHLLGSLDHNLTQGISSSNVQTNTPKSQVAHLSSKNPDHPLLDGTRSIQKALWNIVPLGYSTAHEASMTLVDKDTFKDAGGRVAGTTSGDVAAGTLLLDESHKTIREVVQSDDGSIQIIASLLPPAKQSNPHPFGVLDYSLTFLGHTMLTNALGYVQKRFNQGEEVASLGGEAIF